MIGKREMILLSCMLLLAISSCHQINKNNELQITLTRRSVLDQRPRMLTLRYEHDLWLAYDLQHMIPRKLWTGGVLWNGAAFNNVKTLQPKSYGNVYTQFNEEDSYWKLKNADSILTYRLQFNSYELTDDQRIILNYTIFNNYCKIQIKEEPRLFYLQDSIIINRKYQVRGLPKGYTLLAAGKSIDNHSVIGQKFLAMPTPKPPTEPTSNHGAQYWLDRSGCNTCHLPSVKMVGPSYVEIANRYPDDELTVNQLVSTIKIGSSGNWGEAQMIAHPNMMDKDLKNMVKYILSLRSEETKPIQNKSRVSTRTTVKRPGFGTSLEGIHPSYDLVNIRPADFKPRVGGMTFLSDGSLLVSTWDSIGAVYKISGLEHDHVESIKVDMIASGLAEPLGITTVKNDIFVLQKQELTKLVDLDNDGIIDEYQCVNNQFGVTPDFHEFSYGLLHLNGRFYGSLGLAMRLMSTELQHEHRGTVFSVSNTDDFKVFTRGLRQPNGIGIGPNGDLFVTENQGQWVPACKLIHVKPHQFYGCQFGTANRFSQQKETPPAVWLPQDEIGNSPSEPILIMENPYVGQMILGDVTHGGIKRVFLEKVNDEYQGCVFRFSQGLEAGVNRLVYGPDGALYVGGVGMNGGWSHQERQFGLQKLKYNNHITFEMLSISLIDHGFIIKFTNPLGNDIDFDQSKIKLDQWYYLATSAYGGPKLGLQELKILTLDVAKDRKTITLEVEGLKEGYVVHFLLDDSLVDNSGQALWSGEAWYTINNLN